jgi:hypothetical protein
LHDSNSCEFAVPFRKALNIRMRLLRIWRNESELRLPDPRYLLTGLQQLVSNYNLQTEDSVRHVEEINAFMNVRRPRRLTWSKLNCLNAVLD